MTTEIMFYNGKTKQWEVGWKVPRFSEAAPERIYWQVPIAPMPPLGPGDWMVNA